VQADARTSFASTYSPFVLHPAFEGLITVDGRRVGLCWDEKPQCIEPGHELRFKGGPVLTDTIGTCTHRPSANQAECGAQVYAALLTFGGSAAIRGSGERIWLVVEVTSHQKHKMKTEPMLFLEKMSLLRCALHGVREQLLERANGVQQGGR
jgi:hypothetical protein